MGVPTTGGARGSITIDTSQLASAQAQVNAFAQGVNASLGGINPQIAKTQSAFAGLGGSLRQVAGAFGVSLGVAGVAQLGRAAVAATEVATAYNRQAVAARSLAGGQAQLNRLLETYGKASGGAVDQVEALQSVTKLMAVGFADSNKELEQFTRAIRGISIAMGTSQDTVTQNLILELFTQRGARLDQLGLEYSKVRQRADELQASDSTLTQAMAYQNAVLEQAQQKFGSLADSAEGQKTGVEKLASAWHNWGLAIGEVFGGPINAIADFLAKGFDAEIQKMQDWLNLIESVKQGLRGLGVIGADFSGTPIASRTSIGRVTPQRFGNTGVETAEERAIKLNWAQGIEDLTKQTHDDIIEEEQSFGQSRAKTVADYTRSVARAEEDFGRQRLRANLDQLDAIQDVLRDATRREQSAAEDLARGLARSRADSAEREVEIREDATKRLTELDENYEKQRVKRAKDLSDDLLDAAGKLDAKQVYELQRNAAKQEEEAKEAHDDQREKLQAQLDERLDDERKNLDKSIRQQQEAYDRQIEQGREADRIRLADMAEDFEKRKAREDEDYQKQTQRRAEDQALQLAEMDRAHGLRLNQIRTHAIEERATLQEEADKALVEAQAADAATRKRQEEKEKHLEDLWDKFHNHIAGTLGETTPRTLPGGPVRAYAGGGYVPNTGLAYLHAGEYVMPPNMVRAAMNSNNSRSISVGDIHISGAPEWSEAQWKHLILDTMTEALEQAA